jgi:peptidyl-prolyl cis-trans isomerase C
MQVSPLFMKSKGPLAIAIALSVFAAPAVQSADPAKKPASPSSPDKKTVPAKAEAESAPVKAEAGPAISDPVAVVEGVEIKKTDLDAALTAALAQSGRTPAEIPPEQKLGAYNMVLEDLIAEKLINKRSGDIKITDDEVTATLKRFTGGAPDEQVKEQIEKSGRTVEAVREDIRQSLRQQRWVEEQVKGKVAVTDAEAEEFYKTNQDKFKAPERVRASHILVSVPADAKPEAVVEKEKAAQAIAARVKKGEDFAKLAQELSEDPSAKQNSGDLDFFAKAKWSLNLPTPPLA